MLDRSRAQSSKTEMRDSQPTPGSSAMFSDNSRSSYLMSLVVQAVLQLAGQMDQALL